MKLSSPFLELSLSTRLSLRPAEGVGLASPATPFCHFFRFRYVFALVVTRFGALGYSVCSFVRSVSFFSSSSFFRIFLISLFLSSSSFL